MNTFVLFPTDAADIIKIVSELKNKSSFGYDNIPVNIMKSTVNYIADPIITIINSSMNVYVQCVFADALKIAKVCPWAEFIRN